MSTWETPEEMADAWGAVGGMVYRKAFIVGARKRDRQTAARLRADLLPHLAHAPLTRAVVDALLADLERT